MAKYLDLLMNAAQLADPSVTVTETHLEAADRFVDLVLRERGIDPDAVTLPNATLAEISSNWAKRVACVEGAIGENSPLIDKGKQLETTARTLVKMLSRQALGIAEPTGSAFGQVALGRG